MQIPMYQVQNSPQQVDICFYNCFKQIKRDNKCLMFFYVFRIGLLIWYTITHFQLTDIADKSVYDLVTVLFIGLIAFNIATFIFAYWVYRNILSNQQALYQIAQRIQHTRVFNQFQENNQNFINYFVCSESPYLRVNNKVYQFTNNIEITDIDEQYKRRAERNCSSLVSQQVDRNNWSKFWGQLFNLCSIAAFVYSIVILAQGQGVTSAQFTFIITYLFTQVCTRLFIYLILFLIGISPLCCVVFCIYSCFIKKQRVVQLPQTQQANLDIIKECQGQCPICFQNLVQKQKVVVLRCSPKHVFHELCIKGWSKIGKNCPVCRAQI